MAHLPVEFHPAAVREAREARAWYEDRNPDVAVRFQDELDVAIDAIADRPNRSAP